MILKQTISKKHGELILKEMCDRVGINFDTFDFSEPNWYQKYTWSEEDQESFRVWLSKKLTKWGYVKGMYRGHSHALHEADKLILSYGWKVL